MTEPIVPRTPPGASTSPVTRSYHSRTRRDVLPEPRAGVFFPMLLLALAVAAGLAFQTVQLGREYQQWRLAKHNLEPQHQAAAKLRSALDALATATPSLAGTAMPTRAPSSRSCAAAA